MSFWLAGALLWALIAPASAQPLERGVNAADGRHFFLEEGKIRTLTSDFADGATFGTEVAELWQGASGWGGSFLIKDGQGLKRVRTTAGELTSEVVLSGDSFTVSRWGDNFLVQDEGGQSLWLVTPVGQETVKLPKPADQVSVLDGARVLIKMGEQFAVLQAPSSGTTLLLEPLSLPFPAKGAAFASSSGQAVLWNQKSSKVLRIEGERGVTTLTLPEAPSLGMKPLENGYAVALGATRLLLISPEGQIQENPRPSLSNAASLTDWTLLVQGRRLLLLTPEKERTRMLLFSGGGVPSALLPEGIMRAAIAPAEGSAGPTFVFMEFSADEDKLDEGGRTVLDLETGKPVRRVVTGHRLFAIGQDGQLRQLAHEPRAALVGPIQRVGDRIVYATQTEPSQSSGQPREVDPRFPQPPVVLYGRSAEQPDQLWSYERPRGESISKERLPEAEWPRLGADGPLLLTDESASVLALDLEDGRRLWSSPELAMDESSPLMLEWEDGLGVISAKGTGRTFTALEAGDGKIKASLTLTPFFFIEKWRHLLGVITVCAALGYYIYAAGRRTLYIRKIAGLQALDEAVGRATEMGKPVLYVVGLADVDDIQTMASLSILSHVARKTAEYDTPIVTTTARAVAFSAAQEIVRDAFSVAGRPDAFSVESVRYISDDQFGYTAGVDGIMVREKPAANFYIGNFYAESLILAETGYATGSIQIAGTAQPSQVPFFVAACDYTLIGEELFAASAYLSRDPLQVGSLRGQDVGKAIIMVLLVVCSLLLSLGLDWAQVSARIAEATGVLLP